MLFSFDPDDLEEWDGDDYETIGADDKSRTFGPYLYSTAKKFLDKAASLGMTVTGQNPWHVVANQHGIEFDVTHDEKNGNVQVTVASKNFYVGYGKIWDKLAPMLPPPDVAGSPKTIAAAPPPSTRWDDLAKALAQLDTYTTTVSGDTAVHFYPPMTAGELADLLDELHAHGWDVQSTSPTAANLSKDANVWRIVVDEDLTRVQILKAPVPAALWSAIDVTLGQAGAHVVGSLSDWTPPASTDPQAHADYLQRVYDHAKETWHEIQSYDDAKRKEAAKKLAGVVDKARTLAHDVKQEVKDKAANISDTVQKKVATVSDGLDGLWDDVKSFAGWGALAIGGVAIGWWIVIGVGAYAYLKHSERRAA